MFGWDVLHHRSRSGLFTTLPHNSHHAALAQKSTRRNPTGHTQPDVVVAVVRRVVVAGGGAALGRVIVPGPAPQHTQKVPAPWDRMRQSGGKNKRRAHKRITPLEAVLSVKKIALRAVKNKKI